MKKGLQRVSVILLVFALLFTVQIPVSTQAADSVEITVLETSDIHGRLMAYDYATDKPATTGLTTVAAVIKEERTLDPDLILVDNGDLTQGNMVSEFRDEDLHPAIAALNYLKYDAWELGNHEFNYEFDNLTKNIEAFDGTVLAGNVYKKDGTRFVEPYIIKEVDGVRVAIFGIVAPHVPTWESNPANYDNMIFKTPMEETDKILNELEKEDVDVIIGLVHYGEDGEHATEGMYDVAEKYADKVDAFLIGHAHSTICKYLVDGEWTDEYAADAETVIMEPGTNGTNVAKLSIKVEKDGEDWKVADTTGKLIDTSTYTPDEGLIDVLSDVHEASVEMANTVVGQIAENFFDDPYWLPGIPYAVIEDSALMDLINTVQMKITGADVSLAALFDSSSNLLKGDFMLKDGVKVYKYDNTLFAIKCTGKQLKAIMEVQAGNFFNQYKEGDVTISFNPNIRLYNYDMFAGVDYQIDISKPAGERIVNVMYKGAPLKDDEKLVLALNNYRCSGLINAGYLNAEDVVYDSAATADVPAVRDMIARYVADAGGLTPVCDNNWEIIGADLSDPQAEEIYKMIRDGELVIPSSADGRTSNVESVNADALRASGVIKLDVCEHTVVAGDTLGAIARANGCSVAELVELNAVKNNMIYVGETILIPNTEVHQAVEAGNAYVVAAGDCLSKIAAANGTTVEALAELNGIKNKDLIYAGHVLILK